jgi:hypothetical protein
MRCPSCGTDNAPDSRFCGGCGARFSAPAARVAPTEKIADDARFPQHRLAPAGGAAAPVTAPGVAPPRAIPATPFMPHGAPRTPRPLPAGPLGAGSVAPARPMTASQGRPAAAQSAAPPAAPPAAPAPRPPRPQIVVIDDPSPSLPIAARRPWGLIAAVLVIDVGLAVGGVWMLSQGLR